MSMLLTSILKLANNVRQLFAADIIFRCIFPGALRVNFTWFASESLHIVAYTFES